MSCSHRHTAWALGVLIGIAGEATAGTAVEFFDYPATYLRTSVQVLPPATRTYSVSVTAGTGLAPDAFKIVGLERVETDGDLQVDVRAQPAQVGDAQLQSFSGAVTHMVNGQPSYPSFDYTIFWHDLTLVQDAEVLVTPRGATPLASGSLGGRWQLSLGKPDRISAGILQACAGPRCVMKNEPASSPDVAAKRIDYLVETFATDARLNGGPVVASGGRERAGQLVAQAREKLAAEPANPYSAETQQRINGWLERNYGSGERSATLKLANVPGDARFEEIRRRLEDSAQPDAAARRDEAEKAWRTIAEDRAAKPRVRAAALYNCAVMAGVAGRLGGAGSDLAAAELENAGEKDGMFGTKHGAVMSERITGLRQWLSDRGPAPAP